MLTVMANLFENQKIQDHEQDQKRNLATQTRKEIQQLNSLAKQYEYFLATHFIQTLLQNRTT